MGILSPEIVEYIPAVNFYSIASGNKLANMMFGKKSLNAVT